MKMVLLQRLLPSLGARVAVPALLILLATVATLAFSVAQMAEEANKIEDALTTRSTQAAIDSFVRALGDSHQDYARWDDAVRALYGTVDEGFVDQNYVSSTESTTFFDTAFLIDENGNDVFGFRGGERIAQSSRQAFGPPLTILERDLPFDGRTYGVATGIVRTPWGLEAVAVGPVVPNTATFEAPPARTRLLVIARAIDDGAVSRLGTNYVIKGLRLAGADTTGGVALRDPAGTVLGRLTWTRRNLGTQAQARVAPVVWLMLAALFFTMLLLIGLAVRAFREITRREELAQYSATHDPLTGLPNREVLVAAIANAGVAGSARAEHPALVSLDLDGFKQVNDQYGHAVGDKLLVQVASRLRATVAGHLLVRLSGDEFAVFVSGSDAKKRSRVLSRNIVAAIGPAFEIDGRQVTVGASLGVADAADRTTPEELLRQADVAMYQAKQEGPNRYFVYDDVFDRMRARKVELGNQLRGAIARNELSLVYQPLISASSGRIIAGEALLRWTHPTRGAVPPSEFIPVAEETGLIETIGAWALREAAHTARHWPGLRLAVNVSPVQFRTPGFAQTVATILGETGLEPHRLEIEVTETYMLDNPDRASAALDDLRRIGVVTTLDDFGTGYSSIGYLRRLKFDKLKIDQSLVAGIVRDDETQRVVQATIALADVLGLAVTAEGVETEAQAVLLRAAGCDEFQGFLFSKPLGVVEFEALIRADVAFPASVVAA